MKQGREDVKAKLIEEAPEGTPLESIQVTLNDEIAIMVKECGRKGGKVHGVGAFPRLDISSSSSMPINSEWNEMKDNLEKLSSTVNSLESENVKLKSMLRAIFSKLHGSTSNNGNYDVDDNFVQGSDDGEGIDEFPGMEGLD
jgi:hypothetical protein